jgi:Ca-activated chloride channel family protein
MKTLINLIFMMMLFIGFTPDENQTVTGYVFDQNNKTPLPGVLVKSQTDQKISVLTNAAGYFKIKIQKREKSLIFSFKGYTDRVEKISNTSMKIFLTSFSDQLKEIVVMGYGTQKKVSISGIASTMGYNNAYTLQTQSFNTEAYSPINENGFKNALENPLSTFSADVDAASYSNVRRFIQGGQLPPKDAVRIEEMINYFGYDYPEPKGDDPVSITTEMSEAPWNKNHRLVKIGLRAKSIKTDNLPASNLVFLIDVSGSMAGPNRIELVKTSLKLLTDQLRENDKVAIVVYAGAAGLVLPPTAGNQKNKIKAALNNLEAGGSTAGGAGIKLAYEIAKTNFIDGGNNRVILATDGDFNVGVSSDGEMQRLIEEQRKSGVFLSVLGYGMGNYKDSKMEILANKGNGNYAYIDNLSEAKKVLINEFGSTLYTVAKDVKLQVEFNPAKVAAYRLIGYENRLLNNEDFKDDQKDAGEMGAGHTVTALYEVILKGTKSEFVKKRDDLKYITNGITQVSNEILTVKMRYKETSENKSKEISVSLVDKLINLEDASADFKFAAAVAEFGLLIRDSEFKQQANFDNLISLARAGKGKDNFGYRAGFISIAENAKLLSKKDLISNQENEQKNIK